MEPDERDSRRELQLPPQPAWTRRRFVQAAMAGGAMLGLGGLAAACGDDDDGAGGGDTGGGTGGGDTGGNGGGGGTIRIGYVTPRTGPLAEFGQADGFVLAQMREQLAGGLTIAGTSYAVEIIDRDSESSSQTAASVAQELILDDQVDLVLVSSTPDTTVPVAQQCTNNEVPCISTVAPWQPHYLGIGGALPPAEEPPPAASEWNFHFFWGLEDIIAVFIAMWNQVAPGAAVGGLWPDDPDGNAWSDPNVGFPPALEEAGFTVVDPGRFPLETNDFTAQINAFREAGVEIVSGVLPPPVFGNFWAQAQQQGFTPRVVTVGKGLLFPGAVESFENPAGLSSEVWWTDRHPFSSSITSQSSADLAAAFEEDTGGQWTQPLGFAHALFEVALDALTRAGGAGDKAALRDAIGATSLDTIVGKIDFSAGPVGGISKTLLVGGQWLEGDDHPFELAVVENSALPDVPVDGELQAL